MRNSGYLRGPDRLMLTQCGTFLIFKNDHAKPLQRRYIRLAVPKYCLRRYA